MNEQQISEHIAMVRARIEKYGFTMISVLDEEDTPAYTYTCGLQANFSHPDLIMFGIGGHACHAMFTTMGDRIKAGERFASGERVLQVANMPLLARRCGVVQVGGYVSRVFNPNAPDYLQLVWPDERGRFPWQAGFDATMRDAQPLLFDQ